MKTINDSKFPVGKKLKAAIRKVCSRSLLLIRGHVFSWRNSRICFLCSTSSTAINFASYNRLSSSNIVSKKSNGILHEFTSMITLCAFYQNRSGLSANNAVFLVKSVLYPRDFRILFCWSRGIPWESSPKHSSCMFNLGLFCLCLLRSLQGRQQLRYARRIARRNAERLFRVGSGRRSLAEYTRVTVPREDLRCGVCITLADIYII